MKPLRPVGENIWLVRFPLRLLGVSLDRNVTIIRLSDGRLIVDSTAPFDKEDVASIRALGEPAWLVDATLFHDTYAAQGRAAFPGVPYVWPAGEQLAALPAQCGNEIEVLPIGGIPKTREHLFFHRASRTLIVCDLVFNFTHPRHWWEPFFLRYVMRLPRLRGMSFFMRMTINDRAAFSESIARMMRWDFERLIVGHGDPVDAGAKTVVREALQDVAPEAFA